MRFEVIHGHLNRLNNPDQTRARALIRARMLPHGDLYFDLLIHMELTR